MPFIDREDHRVMERARDLLTEHHTIITTALRVYAERMDAAATEAKAAHETGADTPLISNDGFRMAAEQFTYCSGKARAAAEAIDSWQEDSE
ncbi:hypothetical protein Ppa06_57520 [Planomonospora parontospora subsp. parontospora]|uniref:Uncharacterized protein n=2 Tax=Planomonospora parontospora TaxID=58119 RepID=A0AA37F783_9ACTN|nr:hypothetical protein [Planomonospora parontospora]GGK90801.1 hypothetical protein GCM10010126_57790 [Planomonospora parontospora]GII11954.1 hypothetical protein Ppa06_57520 [Planomonospora parontospora subsp. parontospora]